MGPPAEGYLGPPFSMFGWHGNCWWLLEITSNGVHSGRPVQLTGRGRMTEVVRECCHGRSPG
jgi:hypothetical protein